MMMMPSFGPGVLANPIHKPQTVKVPDPKLDIDHICNITESLRDI